VRDLDGGFVPVSPVISSLEQTGNFNLYYRGASPDLSSIVFAAGSSTLFAGEAFVLSLEPGLPSNLYEVAGAGGGGPQVRIVNRASDGGVIGGSCGAEFGGISADSSAVYFTARAGEPAGGLCLFPSAGVRIFKRMGGASTVEVSACAKTLPATCGSSGDDVFRGMSADGDKALFTTARQLTDSDGDATDDLYLYDASPPAGEPNLVQVSAGELVPGPGLGDPPAHTVGVGAQALGVADVAMDGSRVYFVAKGRLTASAVEGSNNLYVYERSDDHPQGRTALVATLAAGTTGFGDPTIWGLAPTAEFGGKPAYALPRYEGAGIGRSDGDGRLLIFRSTAALLPAEDGDGLSDVYRYDDQTGELECLSCVGDGDFDADIYGRLAGRDDGDQVQQERIASEDGSKVVFTTREPLLAQDGNLVDDVYLWDDGQLSLVSGPTGDSGVMAGDAKAAISPDGQSIFFITRATLLPEDKDNGATDAYVARVDGGSPQTEPPALCDVLGGECHGIGDSPTITDPTTDKAGSSGDAVSGDRVVLSLGGLSRKARVRASRSGRLVVRVRASSATRLRVSARARIGGRARRIASASTKVGEPGVATARLRLSGAARRVLGSGRDLVVVVRVSSTGARARSMTVRLPGASS
jgi:hypothetical protein